MGDLSCTSLPQGPFSGNVCLFYLYPSLILAPRGSDGLCWPLPSLARQVVIGRVGLFALDAHVEAGPSRSYPEELVVWQK